MKLQYLGTAAAEGFPSLYCVCDTCRRAWEAGGKNIRSRSQSVIDNKLLIDFPPDTYMHMLAHRLPLEKITNCIITHDHSDHFYVWDLEMGYFYNRFDNDSLNKAYELLENCTPLKFDCGALCGGKCCKGGDNDGMILFPGEEKYYAGKSGFTVKKTLRQVVCRLYAAVSAAERSVRFLAEFFRFSFMRRKKTAKSVSDPVKIYGRGESARSSAARTVTTGNSNGK